MKPILHFSLFAVAVMALSGCRGIPVAGENQARRDLDTVAARYRPEGKVPALPALRPDSGISNFVAYALLNSPSVEAAFDDWSASVENITVARSLPDPKLTFQAYIQQMLTSLMPGLMQDFPGPGKLKAAAGVAAADSQAKYFTFESRLLQPVFPRRTHPHQPPDARAGGRP